MSTILFVTACVVLAIIVLSKIPGLEHFVKPIIGIFFNIFQAVLEHTWAWSIFVLKTLWYSHMDLVKHLLLSEDAIDPSVKMKREADNS